MPLPLIVLLVLLGLFVYVFIGMIFCDAVCWLAKRIWGPARAWDELWCILPPWFMGADYHGWVSNQVLTRESDAVTRLLKHEMRFYLMTRWPLVPFQLAVTAIGALLYMTPAVLFWGFFWVLDRIEVVRRKRAAHEDIA